MARVYSGSQTVNDPRSPPRLSLQLLILQTKIKTYTTYVKVGLEIDMCRRQWPTQQPTILPSVSTQEVVHPPYGIYVTSCLIPDT